jgi:hypothetical protein
MDGATVMEAVFDLPGDVPFYDLAPVYDFVYSRNFEYDRQATRVRNHARDDGVLELACGTGRLAARVAEDATYVGVDAAAPMLAVARRNVDAHLVRADVRRVALDRQFGVVALLGRSSAHFGQDDLRSVAAVALEHLEDGGFVLDAHDRATLEDGHATDDRYESDRWAVRYRGESTTTGVPTSTGSTSTIDHARCAAPSRASTGCGSGASRRYAGCSRTPASGLFGSTLPTAGSTRQPYRRNEATSPSARSSVTTSPSSSRSPTRSRSHVRPYSAADSLPSADEPSPPARTPSAV